MQNYSLAFKNKGVEMVRLGWFKIESITGDKCLAVCEYNNAISINLYLQVIDQPGQAETAKGERVFAVWDDVSGEGAVVYNPNGFSFKFGQNIAVSGDVTASGDITASGDVTGSDLIAGILSMGNHIHQVTTAPGNTGTPQSIPEV